MKHSFLMGCLFMAIGFLTVPVKAENVYSIYPIPQQQIVGGGVSQWDVNHLEIVCEDGVDQATRVRLLNILMEHGFVLPDESKNLEEMAAQLPAEASGKSLSVVYLGIHGSGGTADQKATAKGVSREVFSKTEKYDRHLLSISPSTDNSQHTDIIILGENTDAVFYGLASFEQILEQTSGQELQTVVIYDFADQQSRGLVEGYYGYPYTLEVKKDLMRFMMRYKMNTYLYGAKSDPYHSQYWKDAYPTQLTAEQVKNGWLSQDMLKEVAKVSQETKVNFIWAIHPGNDFTNSGSVINDIMGKFNKMYALGVRQFAVFVDDVSVPEDAATHRLNAQRLTDLQRAIEKKWNTEGALPTDTVKPIHFVPQVYASGFVGESARRSFFQALSSTPKNVVIYTTGWGVWSIPNSSDLNVVKQDLGRNVAWWWNYPCNDNADGQLYPMDMYSNFYDMPAVDSNGTLPSRLQNGLGIVSNPMQEGEVSKIPLFSVADYAWNNAAFNNKVSWEAACEALVGPENAEDLRLIAKYLRYNDPAELNALINSYKTSLRVGSPNPKKLQDEMTAVLKACHTLETLKDSDCDSDTLLYQDLKPWLLKLKQMAVSVNDLLTVASMDDEAADKWNTFVPHVKAVEALDTAEDYKAYALEGMGNWISVSVRPSQPSERYLYPFVKFMKENAMNGYFPESPSKPEKFTNLKDSKGNCSTVKGVVAFSSATNTLSKGDYIGISLVAPTLLADMNVADTLLEKYEVLYSSNGKDWKTFTDKETALSGYIKYLCVRNPHEEAASVRLTRNVMSMTPPVPTEYEGVKIPSGDVWDGHTAAYLTDGDYTTFTCLNRNQKSGDSYQLTLTEEQEVGDVRICMGTVNDDYMTVGTVEVSKNGTTWRKLKVKGTNTTDFKMSLPQVVKYSDEMSYCDFQGDGMPAKYVRLYLKTPNTSKWLRFYEMEVNRQTFKEKFQAPAADAAGNSIETLTDALAHTDAGVVQKHLIYNFLKVSYPKAVVIYQGLQAHPASVEVTEDGEHWVAVGTLQGGRQSFDLTDYPSICSLRIQWEGAMPEIYEIVEIADENRLPEITGIEKLNSHADATSLVKKNGVWTICSEQGLKSLQVYSVDGRVVLSQQLSGETSVTLPLVRSTEKVLLVKVLDQHEVISTFKVLLQ